MNEALGDKPRLLHILAALSEIELYIEGATIQEFQSNSMLRFASIKQLEIIGEAARAISPKLKEACPSIPWSEIIGLRNILIHEYFGVDSLVIWQIITTDLPVFKTKIQEVVTSHY